MTPSTSWTKLITSCLAAVTVFSSFTHAAPLNQTHSSRAAARVGTSYNYWSDKAWGANLGNWLILERWMDGSIFQKYAPNAQDEWTFCQQASNPTKALQDHWNSWVTEADFQKLHAIQANHVRIPVGYWAFIKPDVGEPYVTTGQKQQIERILGYCHKYGIHAIIDLHGLPGSQNGEAHSGHITNIGFYSSYNIERSLKTVKALVDWMNALPTDLKKTIASIEAANEPHANSDQDFNTLKNYYRQAFKIIDASPYKVPMMFHDAFKGLGAWNNFLPAPANAVIDLHPYYAFPPNKDQGSIIQGICNTRSSAKSFHLPVFFGEWSLASGVNADDAWLKKMMDTQISIYKGAGAGGTFWALKNKINAREWSLQQLQDQNIVTSSSFSSHSSAQC